MIKSAVRYCKYFFVTAFARPEKTLLWRNIRSWFFTKEWKHASFSPDEKKKCLHTAAKWLLNNQSHSSDKGFSTFYIVEGHTSSYPETSGYIIDSLFNYSGRFKKPEIIPDLIACADWLVSIQKPSGGWQSGYVHQNKKEVVFNTGQVIRGLINAYHHSNNKKYLESCIKACNWLCDTQDDDGAWRKTAFMNIERVYESYVSAPMLQVWKETGIDKFKIAAEKNINWILDKKMRANGWFEDCDNTVKHNDRPILHTIAYTIDGIIDCSILLDNKKYAAKVKKSADALLDIFLENGFLWGRYDRNWKPSEAFICTGGAQISIVWGKLFKLYREERYLEGMRQMNNLLCYIQNGTKGGREEIEGALQGSFPLWGRYEPFAFPNWAAKYLLDALMLESEFR